MSSISESTQVYCDRCRRAYFFDLTVMIKQNSGIIRRALVHSDHVLICNIDSNGTVRGTEIVEIEFNPMEILIEDVANGFHYMNAEPVEPTLMDFYTSNALLKQFIQSIIMKMFEQATTKRIEDKYKFVVETFENRTILRADKILVSVGPFIKQDADDIDYSRKGIILDILEAEKNHLDIEMTLEKYNWAAILVPRDKREGYTHAFSSFFDEKNIPYFVNVIDNETLKELFDFIFAINLIDYN